MKYYIPTATSNFNNILSAESISPPGCYLSRGFGYKSLAKVPPNNLEHRTLLYEVYPKFSLEDCEIESYPMVIEVDTDSIDASIIQDSDICGIAFTEQTVYLNPFTTRIIFRNELEKKVAINNSARSIETKLVGIYSSSLIVKTDEIEEFEWNAERFIAEDVDSSDYSNMDLRTDKIKGFLYGYIIGTNISIEDQNFLDAMRCVNKLENELSVLINRDVGTKDAGVYGELSSVLNALKSKKIDDVEGEKSREYGKSNWIIIYDFLKKEGLYENWRNKLLEYPNSYNIMQFSGTSVKELQTYVFKNKQWITGLFDRQTITSSGFPEIRAGKVVNIPNDSDTILISLINAILDAPDSAELLASSRFDFAHRFATLFKEDLGEQWIGSSSQAYINSLLRNLNESSRFEIDSSDRTMLKSFAAFCCRAQKDNLEAFYEFLISNGIGDVSLAFALWGATFGFSSMPKTVTNFLFSTGDVEYKSEVYKYVYKQLFGIILMGDFKISQINTSLDDFEMLKQSNESISIAQKEPKEEIDSLPENSEWIDFRDEILLNWDEKFEDLVSKSWRKRLKTKTKEEFNIDRLCDESKTKNQFLEQLDLYFVKESPLVKELKKFVKRCKQEVLFDSEFQDQSTTSVLLYKDDNAFALILPIIPEDKQKGVKEQLVWIQKTHREGGYYKKDGSSVYFTSEENTNLRVIEHFERNSRKNRAIDEILLKKIGKQLREKYPG